MMSTFGRQRTSPAIRASGMIRLTISAVRMLNSVIASAVWALCPSGSFHMDQSRTLPL